MPVHLVKLCVGAATIDDLAQWQKSRMARKGNAGKRPRLFHATHQTPRRTAELLDGGSMYWVIKGVIQVRQKLLGFEEGAKSDGTPACHIMLDPELIPVRSTRRRAFQGWRYLDADDAPPDLGGTIASDLSQMPPRMRRELAELGLI